MQFFFLNCRNTLALLSRDGQCAKKGSCFYLFLWTEGGNSFLSVCGWFNGCSFSTGSKAHRQGIFYFFFLTPEACRWMALSWSLWKSSRCCSCFTYIVLLPVAALMMRHLLYLWRQLVFVRHNEIKIQPLMKMKEIGKRIKFSSLSLSLEKFWWLKMSEILVEHLGSFLKDIF